MRVLEEHRKDLEPKKQKENQKYIYKCDQCGSILEMNEEDTLHDYFTCPVCAHYQYVSLLLSFFHRENIYDFFHTPSMYGRLTGGPK